ncbi:MAG: CoA transferase [Dehalococcoidia bacterium]|nr:CoA transferase [Dehalococcoidia bacterium]MCA9854345.1 CoA transferase [Dehalococcoidia bacterium]
MTRPLTGVRVLDFTEYVAGPYGTMMLADLGAEVVKVEPLDGDHWRRQQPLAPLESRYFVAVNRGKRSLSLDIFSDAGRAVVDDLIREADVVIMNYRQPTVERLRLDYDSVRAVRPDVIYCNITAFGTRGPFKDRAGFDLLMQAMTGIMDFERKVDRGVPVGILTVAPADLSAGMFSAFAVASALYERERTGEGHRIDLSLYAAAMAIQYRVALSIDRYDAEDREAMLQAIDAVREQGLGYEATLDFRSGLGLQRATAHYYRAYQAKDGMVAVACLNNRQRRALRDELGIEDEAVEGGVFEGREMTGEEHSALMDTFEEKFLLRTVAEWLEIFERIDVPSVPVRLTEEIFTDPQAAALGLFQTIEHPALGPITSVRSPLEFDHEPMANPLPSPALGGDADSILADLGYSAERVAALREAGVLRAPE